MAWFPDGGFSWLTPPAPAVQTAGAVPQTPGGAQAAVTAGAAGAAPVPPAVRIAASLARARQLRPVQFRRISFD